MISDIRVGFPTIGGRGWMGGVSHTELLVKALHSLPPSERPKLFLIVNNLDNYECYKPFVSCFDSIIYWGPRDTQAIPGATFCRSEEELFRLIDFYFPVNYNVMPGRPAASWIHDFQHHYLPELFSLEEVQLRTELCRKIANQAALVYCTSRAVEKDFWDIHPYSQATTRVLSLRVSPETEWYAVDPAAVQSSYGLPDSFILCCNQFWQHKNHRLLFEAIAGLRQLGCEIPLVCTGATSDFRRPEYYPEIKQYIKDLGISDLVYILGSIPRQHQIQLIRRSLFVVQPSLFEGLSLIVQECRALGKPIILSDLDAHLEHEYGVYFSRTSLDDLIKKIIDLRSAVTSPGPDIAREKEAKLQAVGLTRIYANSFVQMVKDAQEIFRNQKEQTKPRTSGGKITLATSLSTTANLQNQRQAVESWLKLGFDVISVNTPDDCQRLAKLHPEISCYPAKRSSATKGEVFIDDITAVLKQQNTAVCGIIAPDTCLFGDNLFDTLWHEARQYPVYGDRTDIEPVIPCTKFPLSRYGYIFFNRTIADVFSQAEFTLGSPWWDYWAVYKTLKENGVLRKIITPAAFRIIQPAEDNLSAWLHYAQILVKHVNSTLAITPQTLAAFHAIISGLIAKHSVSVSLT
jgi:glycosyltransferase involved in cell wall biosynthesis